MHKALRDVLGAHVQQKGSLVDADKTRFDFAHNAPMTAAEISKVESIVNAEILANVATNKNVNASIRNGRAISQSGLPTIRGRAESKLTKSMWAQ